MQIARSNKVNYPEEVKLNLKVTTITDNPRTVSSTQVNVSFPGLDPERFKALLDGFIHSLHTEAASNRREIRLKSASKPQAD